MNEKFWIWFYGDFEIYHAMKQNFTRTEGIVGYPPFWKMDDWNKTVVFRREYDLKEDTEFVAYSKCSGYVLIEDKKYPFGEKIKLKKGKKKIEISVGSMTLLPCVYVDGEAVYSDSEWRADNYIEETCVGTLDLYTKKEQDPNEPEFSKTEYLPIITEEKNGGVFFDFGREINGTLKIKLKNQDKKYTICYGESVTEALDVEDCYYKTLNADENTSVSRRAFRYIFVPNAKKGDINIVGISMYIPIEIKSKFSCDDERLNKIWSVSAETYKLCSDFFFTDGIKRDRWIWSGDAYQSYFVNPYVFFDENIDRRTILALRGNKYMCQHINTILDYSLIWILSIEKEYDIYGCNDFVEKIYPKMEALMDFVSEQINSFGFVYGRERDWVFVDWADFDRTGCLCAEQILLWKSYISMARCGEIIGKDAEKYRKKADELKSNIIEYYWNEEKSAFIDSYESGKNNVTRHANIFALLFDFVDEEKREKIIKNVLLNDKIPQICTPYFKFFELDALCKFGYLRDVFDMIHSYWGGMLDLDATTFWEQFDPNDKIPSHYQMYGMKYAKSLCHAWSASPIYLLGRYFIGVRPLDAGYKTFAVEPHLEYFKSLECEIPIKDGKISISYNGKDLKVTSDREGGILIYNGKTTKI